MCSRERLLDLPQCQHLNVGDLREDRNLERHKQAFISNLCAFMNKTTRYIWEPFTDYSRQLGCTPCEKKKNITSSTRKGTTQHLWWAEIYQQFSFFTLSKSEALALARTSFRVSFISYCLMSSKRTNILAHYMFKNNKIRIMTNEMVIHYNNGNCVDIHGQTAHALFY